MNAETTFERLARLFHEFYEELAPEFGYETRAESAVPWEQVPENNRQLMIAVCERVLGDITQELLDERARNDELAQRICDTHLLLSTAAKNMRDFILDGDR